jgi:hypothetical protein
VATNKDPGSLNFGRRRFHLSIMPQTTPSHERRQALRQADVGNTIRVLDSYPLSKYFDISQRLLDAFQKAVDGRRLDEAYVYGLRFAAFGVESLPKHKEWRMRSLQTPKYNKLKRRNAQQVEKVISMMEIIKQRMDAEELVLQEKRRRVQEEERRNEEEATQTQHEIEEQQAREKERRLKQLQLEREKHDELNSKSVEQSAMAKLLAMQSQISAPKLSEEQPSSGSESRTEQKKTKTTGDHRSSQSKPKTKSEPSLVSSEEKKTDQPVSRSSVDDKKLSGRDTTSVSVDGGTKPLPTTSSSTPSKPTSKVARTTTPRSSKEQKIIDLLENTIRLQEKRLTEIETTQIPALVRMAKEYLRQDESNREKALKCVARKRALERQADVIKAAIFNMETQMFMLENAMEDRQVHKALEEAAHAMKSLQTGVGDSEAVSVDLMDLAATLPNSMLADQDEDDEELLEELQGWISPGLMKKIEASKEDDEVSILSMPNVPTSVAGISSLTTEASDSDPSTVEKLLKAVLG